MPNRDQQLLEGIGKAASAATFGLLAGTGAGTAATVLAFATLPKVVPPETAQELIDAVYRTSTLFFPSSVLVSAAGGAAGALLARGNETLGGSVTLGVIGGGLTGAAIAGFAVRNTTVSGFGALFGAIGGAVGAYLEHRAYDRR